MTAAPRSRVVCGTEACLFWERRTLSEARVFGDSATNDLDLLESEPSSVTTIHTHPSALSLSLSLSSSGSVSVCVVGLCTVQRRLLLLAVAWSMWVAIGRRHTVLRCGCRCETVDG